jgi:tetratricopeptide (TPR) repeat protein
MAVNPEQQLEKAEEAIKKGNFTPAIEMLFGILLTNPGYVKARALIREAGRKEREKYGLTGGQKLVNALKSAALVCKLFIMKLTKKQQQIMELGERYLLLSPKSVFVQRMMGETAEEQGDKPTAIFIYQQVLQQMPQDVPSMKKLGKLHDNKEEIDKAQEYYRMAQKIAPADREIDKAIKDINAQLVSINLAQSGKTQKDRSVSSSANVEDARKQTQANELVRTEDQLEERIKYLEEELKKNPAIAHRWKEYGKMLERKKEWEKARKAYETAREKDPSNYDYNVALGDLELNKLQAQINELREKLKAEPNSVNLKERISALEKERFQKEITDYEGRVRAYPTENAPKERLGELFFKAKRFDDAIDLFQQVKRDPIRFGRASYYLGRCYFQKQEYDLSLQSYRDALERMEIMDDVKKETMYRLGELYEATGDLNNAVTTFTSIYQQDIKFRDVAQKREQLREKLKAR